MKENPHFNLGFQYSPNNFFPRVLFPRNSLTEIGIPIKNGSLSSLYFLIARISVYVLAGQQCSFPTIDIIAR